MKNLFLSALGALAVLWLSGCASERLQTGKYEARDRGRGDFAVVYHDLIFLRVKSPAPAPGQLAYWEWAGKYSIRPDGALELDMDRETLKRWNFYYIFFHKGNAIGVEDLTESKRFDLLYQRPMLRGDRPQDELSVYSSGGVNPIYKTPVVEKQETPNFE